MAIKFQFNKTALNDLNKQLKIRVRALPTIKNKESALRLEVKKAKTKSDALSARVLEKMAEYDYMVALWGEFEPGLVSVVDVQLGVIKIAGVKIPILQDVVFSVKEFNYFAKPFWFAEGIIVLKELAAIGLEREFFLEKMRLLDFARKKTTQKVNLYEKVQIPGYEEAIRKIKRFLEDEENLSKSAQKIVKQRLEMVEDEQ
ncbi:V-type ATP synthase subunit D [Williamwhitmania taraxaci]|uniref:V/A-type H+-transporting ATPase subunit D n=1 Tax=Williamwhitmania taraxaci TaxID=1640674 RepID=A0A1G6HW80_9BACT|nr:V-type ATP synthase subunit D [Williamwhitmania taraxaci]SDB98464.1 V/A-type H+-transporting ATPase subunit D [Williamwhitmania taraxaci]